MLLENLRKLAQTNQIALSCDGKDLSYKDLWKRTQALAHYLKEQCDDPSPLGIYGDKENDMVVAFFACIYARKTYVTLPSAYPEQRLQAIVENCQAKTVFYASEGTGPQFDGAEVIRPTDVDAYVERYKDRAPLEYVPENLKQTALISYTSGSTGTPKGVEISYENLEYHITMDHLVMDPVQEKASGQPCIVNVAPYGFVAGLNVFYLLGTLGWKLVSLPSRRLRDSAYIHDAIMEAQPIFLSVTPSFAYKLTDMDDFDQDHVHQLMQLLLAGEALPRELVQKVLKRFPQLRVLNVYGSTETAGIGSICHITRENCDGESAFMPVHDGTHPVLRLLDEAGNEITEEHQVGELVFVEPALAKGYYCDPERTASTFFAAADDLRAYRTGDLGVLNHGNLCVVGRKDNQVKIGGNRVELEDVEAHLRRCSWVDQCAVAVRTEVSGAQSLVGFVVLKAAHKDAKQMEAFLTVKRELMAQVEPYKVPQKIVFVNELPKSTTGKVDRSRLKEWANQ